MYVVLRPYDEGQILAYGPFETRESANDWIVASELPTGCVNAPFIVPVIKPDE